VRALVLSDLHLGSAAGTATDDAFVSFVEWLTESARRDAGPLRLVLLGDLLDLLHAPVGARDPLAALDAVAARHRSALAALGVAAADGVVVDIVPGNHDSELVEPELQEHLRALVADAAGTSTARLRSSFRVRPWFLLVPGLLYAEHGSQYHALNAVADPLAPFGRWSGRLPLGAVLDDLFCETEHRARARALPHVLPAALRALVQRGRTDPPTVASLHACAREAGLSAEAPAALRRLADDSWAALLRNARAAVLRRTGYVESRQQQAVAAIDEILAQEGKSVPVYVFAHTHRAGHSAIDSDGARLLWFNAGAWVNAGYGFLEVNELPDGVIAHLSRWDPVARSALAVSGPLRSRSGIAQDRAPTTRARNAGSMSVDSVASP
jgi:UDP-2,3-diacylglucosamine pyrophosphatase LpxH